MPVLGGHRPHENADQSDIDKRKLDHTHKSYVLANDIATQLKKFKTFKNSCGLDKDYYDSKLNKSFVGRFFSHFSKWLKKENVEID